MPRSPVRNFQGARPGQGQFAASARAIFASLANFKLEARICNELFQFAKGRRGCSTQKIVGLQALNVRRDTVMSGGFQPGDDSQMKDGLAYITVYI